MAKFLVLSAALATLPSLPARAAECPEVAPADAKARRALAKEWFSRGEAAQRDGDDIRAIKAYACSLKMVPHASTAFNLASAAEQAGDVELALGSYQAYLDMRSEAPDRAEVEKKIGDLTARLAKARDRATAPPANDTVQATPPAGADTPVSDAADTSAPAQEADPAASAVDTQTVGAQAADSETPPSLTRRRRHTDEPDDGSSPPKAASTSLLWTVTGVGGAMLVGGLALNLGARGKMSDCRSLADSGRIPQAKDACSGAKTFAYTSYAFFGIAAAAAVADAVILWHGARAGSRASDEPSAAAPEAPRIGLAVLPGGAAATASMRF
jgi:tetratricopeptide (TPR) repeat protein